MSININKSDFEYFIELQDLSTSEDAGVDDRITNLLKDHSDSLISDLVRRPNHGADYRGIGSNLRNKELLKQFQSSLGYIQRIAVRP